MLLHFVLYLIIYATGSKVLYILTFLLCSCLLQFKEISFAYEVLTNPEKREVYDRHGFQGLKEGASADG